MTSEHLGEFAAIGTALLWTLSALAWTSAGKYVGAMCVSFIRLVMACLLLMAYGQWDRGLALPLDATRQTWVLLGVSGFLGFFLADLCLFKALLLIGPRLTLLFQSLSPPIAALVSWLVMAEKLTGRHWAAMAVTVAGVAWVVMEQPETDHERHRRQHLRMGVVLAVLAAAGQALGFVLSRKGIGDYDAVAATLVRVLGAMAGYLVLVTALGRWSQVVAATRHRQAMIVMLLGSIVGPSAGVVLCMIALRHCQAGIVATILNTMPILILPCTIVLHGERVSLRAVGGAMVSVLGVAMLVL